MSSSSSVEDEWAAALAEQEASEPASGKGVDEGAKGNAAAYSPAQFQEFQKESPVTELAGDVNLDVILDVPVTLSMEIGRTLISIRHLLQLNQGSVVELDRLAGEPLDVLVNGTLIAHGEVVVVNEKFGIRLTDVISPSERVKKLK
ncbi:MAG: flagellar motor switch protein FliN [Gammaproteobacteria bacterium]|nr:flagellar motor switch protein FliN [Gammaproteobacteria bacterium]